MRRMMRSTLRGVAAARREEPTDSGKHLHQQQRQRDRQDAADVEHRPPSPDRNQRLADECSRAPRRRPCRRRSASRGSAAAASGAYSEASATTFGIAPPSPRPVRKRSVTSSPTVSAWGVSSENDPKISDETMIAHLRPQRVGDRTRRPSRRASGRRGRGESTGPNALQRNAELLGDWRHEEAHGLRVEAVEQQHEAAQQDGQSGIG